MNTPLLPLLLGLDQKLRGLNKAFARQASVTLSQWQALDALAQNPASSATQLSKLLAIHPSTLTPLLLRLKQKKLLHEVRDPRDARRKTLVITREGLRVRNEAQRWLSTLLEELTIHKNRAASLSQALDAALNRHKPPRRTNLSKA